MTSTSVKENPSYKIHNVDQGSEEWFALRLQYPLTASEAQAIGNQGKGLETLVWKKLSEKYSSGIDEDLSNKDLRRGKELEPLAREMYELKTGNTTKIVGFVTNESISKVGGASPDGFSEDGLIEIKCFEDKKHFQGIVNGIEIEPQYMWQMQMQMLFTERNWCDFVAYNPNFEDSLLIKRVWADKEMQDSIIKGLQMGEQLLNNITTQYERNKKI